MHVDSNGDIYTVTRTNQKVWKATTDNSNASLLFNDEGGGGFQNSITVDFEGNVYVSGQNRYIRKWTKSTGVYSNIEGVGTGGFQNTNAFGYGSRGLRHHHKRIENYVQIQLS